MTLDHVAILVDDMNKYINIFSNLGGVIYFDGIAEKYKARCVFIDMGNTDIELIQATEEGTHLDKRLKNVGTSLHHIAINGKGIYPGAKPGMLVNFNKPSEENKILIEEVEYDRTMERN